MRNIKIKLHLSIGLSGCYREGELDFDVQDEATGDQIEAIAEDLGREWVNDHIEWNFNYVL